MRDYQIISPSLEGVLSHGSLLYEGINRPIDLLRILDGPRAKGHGNKKNDSLNEKGTEVTYEKYSKEERKTLDEYFHDLYGVFLKKLSFFIIQSEDKPDETIKLQALLQEIIKVKRWLN